jgi:hypothetical protein
MPPPPPPVLINQCVTATGNPASALCVGSCGIDDCRAVCGALGVVFISPAQCDNSGGQTNECPPDFEPPNSGYKCCPCEAFSAPPPPVIGRRS